MDDLGFNGTGSRFNGRFESGSPILAKQLNDLGAGIQASLPMPYLGAGPSVSFTPGGSIITDNRVDLGNGVCPLQIYNFHYDATADKYYINVSPGMVNNLGVTDHDDHPLTDNPPPKIQVLTDGITTEFKTNYIYIACENSGTPDFKYPDPDVPPYITVKTEVQADTDDVGFLLIGIIKGKTTEDELTDTLETYNYKGCGSLWSERFKCGSAAVQYWWSAV